MDEPENLNMYTYCENDGVNMVMKNKKNISFVPGLHFCYMPDWMQ